jgi:hypothetical protein
VAAAANSRPTTSDSVDRRSASPSPARQYRPSDSRVRTPTSSIGVASVNNAASARPFDLVSHVVTAAVSSGGVGCRSTTGTGPAAVTSAGPGPYGMPIEDPLTVNVGSDRSSSPGNGDSGSEPSG